MQAVTVVRHSWSSRDNTKLTFTDSTSVIDPTLGIRVPKGKMLVWLLWSEGQFSSVLLSCTTLRVFNLFSKDKNFASQKSRGRHTLPSRKWRTLEHRRDREQYSIANGALTFAEDEIYSHKDEVAGWICIELAEEKSTQRFVVCQEGEYYPQVSGYLCWQHLIYIISRCRKQS